MDWHSRKTLSFRVSNTLESEFCTETLEEALRRYGKPEIFNTDQRSQFTSRGFGGALEPHGIQVGMDGRGRVQDNIFIQRLWRTLKYQYIYLHAFTGLTSTTRKGLHQALDNLTPDEVYYDLLHLLTMAAWDLP